MKTTKLPTDILAEHVIARALEGVDNHDAFVDEEITIDLNTLDVDAVDESVVYDDGDEHFAVVVHGTTEDSVSRMTSRGTRHHPPEYESEAVTIDVEITWVPERHGGLGGVDLYAEQRTHPFARPDPEGEWRDV